jgi:hypothetical protein
VANVREERLPVLVLVLGSALSVKLKWAMKGSHQERTRVKP